MQELLYNVSTNIGNLDHATNLFGSSTQNKGPNSEQYTANDNKTGTCRKIKKKFVTVCLSTRNNIEIKKINN